MSVQNPFPNTKPMKEKELRASAVCAICLQKIGSSGFMFYRLSIERHGVDLNAIKRKSGLENFLGSPALAAVMGPDEDMTIPLMDKITITVCEGCADQPITVHELAAAKQPEPTNNTPNV